MIIIINDLLLLYKHIFLLKLVDRGSNISSIERDVRMHIPKASTAINRLSIISKSDHTDKIKWDFFQTVALAVSVLLFRWTTWTPTKRVKKKKALWELRKNSTSCFEEILEAAPPKTIAVRPPTPISQNIQIRRRHEGYCWWSKDDHIGDVFWRNHVHGLTIAK